MNALGILGAVLGGFGGLGAGYGAAEKLDIARKEEERRAAADALRNALLNQQIEMQKQELVDKQAARNIDLSSLPAPLRAVLDPSGAGGQIPRELSGELYKAALEQRTLAREQAQRVAQAEVLDRLGAGSPAMPAAPMPDEAAMYSEATELPARPATPSDPRLTRAAAVLRQGPINPLLSKILGLEEEQWKALPQDSPGLYNQRGEIRSTGMGAQQTERPPDEPGREWMQAKDKHGRTSWTQQRVNLGPERESEARIAGYNSFAEAPTDVQARINAKIDERVAKNSPAEGAKAAALIMAKSGAERQLPLAQVNLHGQVVWDKQTGQPASMGTKLDDALTNTGRYAFLSGEKQIPQMLAIREGKILLSEFVPLVQQLTSTPGANFAQAASMWAQTKAGVENPGVAFDAMKGTILRMAGAMQGSRAQLSDQDRKAVEGMLPTPMDTVQSGMQRLQQVMRVLDAMEAAQIGDLSKVNQANDLLRRYGGSGTMGMAGVSIPSPVQTGSADERAKAKFLGR